MTAPIDLRARAAALLDVLGYRTDRDATAELRSDAARFRSALSSGRYPQLELEWAWADNLDTRAHVDGHETVLGILGRWWPAGAPRPPGTLVLAGRTGPGKTVGAVWLASRRGGEFMTAAALGELELSAEAQLRELIATPVLVIDDIGDETTIGPTTERVRRLLKDRYAAKRTTLATTNLTPPEFIDRYGDHVHDRVRATGGCIPVRGRSRRRTGAVPRLDSITRICRLADLIESVDQMTGVSGRTPDQATLAELQASFDVSEADIADAIERRAAWTSAQGRAG